MDELKVIGNGNEFQKHLLELYDKIKDIRDVNRLVTYTIYGGKPNVITDTKSFADIVAEYNAWYTAPAIPPIFSKANGDKIEDSHANGVNPRVIQEFYPFDDAKKVTTVTGIAKYILGRQLWTEADAIFVSLLGTSTDIPHPQEPNSSITTDNADTTKLGKIVESAANNTISIATDLTAIGVKALNDKILGPAARYLKSRRS